MSSSRRPNAAFFKIRPMKAIPHRPGPVQCVRNCRNCIIKFATDDEEDRIEELTALECFDNLVNRQQLWFFKYQSLQYHVGQVDIMKRFLRETTPLTFFIIANTEASDIKFLNMILDHVQTNLPHRISPSEADNLDLKSLSQSNATVAIPIQLRSCVSDNFSFFQSQKSEPCFEARQLKDMLETCIKMALDNNDFDINIVPVIITKDHNRLKLYGQGSVCVQILEPYKLSTYLNGIRKITQKSTHLVQHIYHDAAKNAAILPTNLVAFLLLHLERGGGINFSELVDFMDWFRKISQIYDLQLGFTGSSDEAVRMALIVLADFIHPSSVGGDCYHPRNIEALLDYADLVVPLFAYYGLISRAILMEYNCDKAPENQLVAFRSGVRIRVMQEKVTETSKLMAEQLELRVPCRKPCNSIEKCVEDTISHMSNFDRLLKIEEPLIGMKKTQRWAGDLEDDDDEEYFRRNRDNPAFKSWIVVSDRDYRRDRLNLFMNSIELYLYQ